jgi:hypothetical protein
LSIQRRSWDSTYLPELEQIINQKIRKYIIDENVLWNLQEIALIPPIEVEIKGLFNPVDCSGNPGHLQ